MPDGPVVIHTDLLCVVFFLWRVLINKRRAVRVCYTEGRRSGCHYYISFVSSQWFNQRSESSRSLKTAAESNFGRFFSLFVVIIIDLQQTIQDGLTVEIHDCNCILQRYDPASPHKQLAVAITYRTSENRIIIMMRYLRSRRTFNGMFL